MINKEYRDIPFSPPDISEDEINEVVNTLRSGWLTTGLKTKDFERKIATYLGTNRAAALNSATAAMEMTLRILGIGEGDEVITTAYTYTATASVINHVGAKIVLVDVQKDTYEIDYEQIGNAITRNTKAVIAVDIAGKMCDYDKLFQVLEEKREFYEAENYMQNLFKRPIVIADSAHGFGATRNNIKSGSVADFTCFSFHAVKNLTTAEGGAVTWRNDLEIDDEWIYNQFMLYSLHGQSKDALSKMQKGSWEYDIVIPAFKCNMTDISASIGIGQLKRYNENLKKRHEIISIYNSILNETSLDILKHSDKDFQSSGHLYLTRVPSIEVEERNEIIFEMAENGVACNVHYKPLPMLTAYKNLGFDIKNFPNSYEMYKNEISLPLHTSLSNDDAYYVAEIYKSILKRRLSVLKIN